MKNETIAQLSMISRQLHSRSLELSHLENDQDIAMLMSALAVTMEAARSLGEDLNQLNGPKGLGADGSEAL